MNTRRLDLSLAMTEPVGSDDDFTDDIPSRPRLLLPYWVYAAARRRVASGEFRDVADLFEVAIGCFLRQLAAADALEGRLASGRATPTAPEDGDGEPPPFPVGPDRTEAEDRAAREALESWLDELLDGADQSVSHAKTVKGGPQ